MTPIVCYIDGERTVLDGDSFDGDSVDEVVRKPVKWKESHKNWSPSATKLKRTGREYRIFRYLEEAEDKVREYYDSLADYDPEELVALIGADTLVCAAKSGSFEDLLDNIASDSLESFFGSYWREFECKHPDFEDYTIAFEV